MNRSQPFGPERATPPPRAFGALLRHHRIQADLTQEALAERAGLSERAISDLERGVSRTPQSSTVDLLAEALQLEASERNAFAAAARREKLQAQSDPPPLLTPVSFPTLPDGSPITTPSTPDEPEEPARLFDKETLDATPAEHPGDLTLEPDGRVPPAAALPSGVESMPFSPPIPLRKMFRHPPGIRTALLIGLVVLISATGVLFSLRLLTHQGSTAPVPVRGGSWIDELQADPTSLIPNGGVGTDDILHNTVVDQALYLPLFYGDEQGQVHPGAAREVPTVQNGGVNADATLWTFHLRPGLLWSDGQPYDARDVDYTWRIWSDPTFEVGNFGITGVIRSAEVSADHLSITFHLTAPSAWFLSAWVDGIQAPLPWHHFQTMAPDQIQHSAENLNPTVTSGPFLMQESQPSDHYTLTRNPRYYLARQGQPYLDQLVFRIGASDATILQNFQAGTVDSTQLNRNLNIPAYQQLSGYRLVTPPTSDVFEALWFNFRNVVLSTHIEVREAIARAIDQQALIQGPLRGFATPLCTDHPSAVHPGYQADAACPEFDLAAANKLLDDNGWVRGADGVRTREGQRLEFDYSTTSDTDSWRTAIGPLIQQNLLAIGIKLDISNYPRDQFFRTIVFGGNPSPPTGAVAGRYDIVETAYAYSNDPDDSNLLACANRPPNGNNFSGYCNQQADTLYQQELATPDAGLRQNIFDQLHQIYVTDLPFITLFSPLSITVVRKGTHNFSPSPIDGETINVWQWWCDRGKC